MPAPLACFLTWTTYGTWLHGNRAGSVDRNHRAPGHALAIDSDGREAKNRALLRHPPVMLDREARSIVEQTIRDHCAHREWKLLALNVRTTHVHVVVGCGDSVRPERIVAQFKAWSTRRLREAGLVEANQKLWAHHASTRYINDYVNLEKAVFYVQKCQ